jgi:FAD:protein FMN transferase
MTLSEIAFPAMGSRIRLLASPGAPLSAARAVVEDLEARLSRFDPESEISRLNADPRVVVPASRQLRAAVRYAIHAAELTGGLADPTLLGAVVRAGYDRSLTGRPRADLRDALAAAPEPHPGGPSPDPLWRHVRVDEAEGVVARPPGVRLDLGGSAKGLAADFAAALLAPFGPCAADIGGDLRVHGTHAVQVLHPLSDSVAYVLELRDEAVATSGIDKRLWWGEDGRPAHHLLDPATGRPAWTGVLSATAVAPTAATAEALAKAAVLAGPVEGQRLLARHGGVLIAVDGTAYAVGADEEPAEEPVRRRPWPSNGHRKWAPPMFAPAGPWRW